MKTLVFTSITILVLLSLVACGTRTVEKGSSNADWPHYSSVEDLASHATDVVRIEVLDKRQDRLNPWLGTPPSGINSYELYIVHRVKVLEVFQGNTTPGDILEVAQNAGLDDNNIVSFLTGDDLVIFVNSFEDGFPAVLLNPHQSAYQVPYPNDSIMVMDVDEELESVHARGDLALPITIGDLVKLVESNFSKSAGGLISDSNEMETVWIEGDWPWYESIEDLAAMAVDVVRVEILDERVDLLNPWLNPPPPGIDPYEPYTVYRVKVLEVFQGYTTPGDILEVAQEGGKLDSIQVINLDKVPIAIGDDLVLFLKSFEDDFPALLLNPYQSVYTVNAYGEFASVHSENDLILAKNDLAQISARWDSKNR